MAGEGDDVFQHFEVRQSVKSPARVQGSNHRQVLKNSTKPAVLVLGGTKFMGKAGLSNFGTTKGHGHGRRTVRLRHLWRKSSNKLVTFPGIGIDGGTSFCNAASCCHHVLDGIFWGGFGQFVFFPRGICVVNRGKTYWASDPFAPWQCLLLCFCGV